MRMHAGVGIGGVRAVTAVFARQRRVLRSARARIVPWARRPRMIDGVVARQWQQRTDAISVQQLARRVTARVSVIAQRIQSAQRVRVALVARHRTREFIARRSTMALDDIGIRGIPRAEVASIPIHTQIRNCAVRGVIERTQAISISAIVTDDSAERVTSPIARGGTAIPRARGTRWSSKSWRTRTPSRSAYATVLARW